MPPPARGRQGPPSSGLAQSRSAAARLPAGPCGRLARGCSGASALALQVVEGAAVRKAGRRWPGSAGSHGRQILTGNRYMDRIKYSQFLLGRHWTWTGAPDAGTCSGTVRASASPHTEPGEPGSTPPPQGRSNQIRGHIGKPGTNRGIRCGCEIKLRGSHAWGISIRRNLDRNPTPPSPLVLARPRANPLPGAALALQRRFFDHQVGHLEVVSI